MQKTALTLVLLVFGALSAYVVWQVGLWAVWVDNLNHPAGQQVFADLVIALSLVMVWMWHDARRTGRTVWPWLLLTLVVGSFGPLLYLLTGKKSAWV